jgi:hypothetical protein
MKEHAVDLSLDRPQSARVYDYLLGGRTNFTETDPRSADRVRQCIAVRCRVSESNQ